jgi:hypothetical protein
MGPENNSFIRGILQKLPCADDFEPASNFHDILYKLGSMLFITRETADKIWRFINKIEVVQIVPWYKVFYFWRRNRQGYGLLRLLGESSWET